MRFKKNRNSLLQILLKCEELGFNKEQRHEVAEVYREATKKYRRMMPFNPAQSIEERKLHTQGYAGIITRNYIIKKIKE